MRKMYKSITKKTLFDLATIKSKKALIEFLQTGEWRSTKQLIAKSLDELKHSKGFKLIKENLLYRPDFATEDFDLWARAIKKVKIENDISIS